VMMPEKDGYEVCDALKNDERTSHIPIILLTAKADLESKLDGLRRGADDYLPKPIVKEELMVRLEMMQAKQLRLRAYFSQQKTAQVHLVETVRPAPTAELPEATSAFEQDMAVEDAFLQKLYQIVEENYADEGFALPQLCQKLGMSRYQLFRKMKALIEDSPSDFIRNYRMDKSKAMLQNGEMTVSEVAWQVGFKDVAHFSKTYQATFGFSPSATNK
jgi:AraC-like DNA-binding protein